MAKKKKFSIVMTFDNPVGFAVDAKQMERELNRINDILTENLRSIQAFADLESICTEAYYVDGENNREKVQSDVAYPNAEEREYKNPYMQKLEKEVGSDQRGKRKAIFYSR